MAARMAGARADEAQLCTSQFYSGGQNAMLLSATEQCNFVSDNLQFRGRVNGASGAVPPTKPYAQAQPHYACSAREEPCNGFRL
jgi:hypothetical protein